MKSDHELRVAVTDELRLEPQVCARGIDVDVTNGVVTLFGSVGSGWEKVAADRTATRVAGVESVVSDLRVRTPVQA